MPPCRAGAALPGRFAETLDSCPHRTTGFFSQLSPQDNWKLFFKVVGLDDNLDIFFLGIPWRGLGRASMPGRRGREAMPGRAESVGLDDSFEFFFLGRIPTLGLAGLRCRAGAAGRLCQAGMWRARRWASPYWASHQTRLGRAIKRGWASQY